MKFLIIFLSSISISYCAIIKQAPFCDPVTCKLPNCRCFQLESIPGNLDRANVPQIVLLTFDDAVTYELYRDYYVELQNRQNPNGCNIAATFFMSHEYTNYSTVNQLYNEGHEIAIHSITHTTTTQYWGDASEQILTDEFAGERQTIAKFANIPESDITGVRTPFLVLANDTTFNVLNDNGLYDCSWPTQNIGKGVYPYTLDYLSEQDCDVGTCPIESHPGTWVVPMVDWIGSNQFPCAMVDTCYVNYTTSNDVLNFIKTNFHRHYDNWREPFGFYVHAAWFQTDAKNFAAYVDFLDYLGSLTDVYIVPVSKAIAWTKNPADVSGSAQIFDCPERNAPCDTVTCQLDKPEPNGGVRYMPQCVDCPPNYPWVGNPLGQ